MSFQSFFFSSEGLEKRVGFYDGDLIERVKEIPWVQDTIQELAVRGFAYCGDTGSSSKANTSIEKKRLFINRNLSLDEASLSLIYELTNAKNHGRFKQVFQRYLHTSQPSLDEAYDYAAEIIYIEAEAVFNRSLAAIELGIENCIKNRTYLEIVRQNQENRVAGVETIAFEMIQSGKVHNGKKSAVTHYISQYLEIHKVI